MPRRPGPAEWETPIAEYKRSGLAQILSPSTTSRSAPAVLAAPEAGRGTVVRCKQALRGHPWVLLVGLRGRASQLDATSVDPSYFRAPAQAVHLPKARQV